MSEERMYPGRGQNERTSFAPYSAFDIPADLRQLHGRYDVESTGRRVRNFRYAEEWMMMLMGGWLATIPEIPVKTGLGKVIWETAQTADALRDGWCGVGDLGRLDEEGYLYLVDRKNNIINSGGYNIFPREIEEVLHHHPAVAEAAVVGRKDDYWGEAVTAFIVLQPGASADEIELKEHCSQALSRYKLPKEFRFQEGLPKNAAGKILHRELRDAINRETEATPKV